MHALTEKLSAVAEHLEGTRGRHPRVHRLPQEVWRQIWSNNHQEWLNQVIRRPTNVVGISHNQDSIIRLVGAVLDEQHDVFAE